MFDVRSMLLALRASTPEQCAEMGRIFASYAKAPRDALFFKEIDDELTKWPKPSLVEAIEAGNARVREGTNTC